MTPQEAIELNRIAWNALVPFHLRSAFYDVAGFKAGRNTLTPNILNAVMQAGFTLERYDEHAEYMCAAWPWRVPEPQHPRALGCFPGGVPRVPLMFSLKAARRGTDHGSEIAVQV